MTSKPFFSVVIPTYNRASLVRNAIVSVLDQGFSDFEVLVIDDGSTDNTGQVVSEIIDKRVQYIKVVNGERGAARNTGFRNSVGEYINFVDSDDLLYPHHLMTAFQFIQEKQSPPVFHLAYDLRNEEGGVLKVYNTIKNINAEVLSGNGLSCNGVFIRRDVMQLNPFNENRALAALEDWELWVRLSTRHTFLHFPEVTSSVIQHGGRSVMTTDISMITRKVSAFIHAVAADEVNQKVLGRNIARVFASANTYGALHIALTRAHKKDVVRYFWRGIRMNPAEIFTKRCMVILKWFFFK